MKTYIACKIVQAEPMQELKFSTEVRPSATTIAVDKEGNSRAGYKVRYPDGYESWSPALAFENSHREILASELELLNPPKQVA